MFAFIYKCTWVRIQKRPARLKGLDTAGRMKLDGMICSADAAWKDL